MAAWAAAGITASAAAAASQPSRPPPGPAPSAPLRVPPKWTDRFSDLSWVLSRTIDAPDRDTAPAYAKTILATTRVAAAIDHAVKNTPGLTRDVALKEAHTILDAMLSDIGDRKLRATGWVCRKMWSRLYDGVRANSDGIERIKQLVNAHQPVALLPMHKSHIDYILITYLCFAHNLYPPHIVAGENLNLPLVGSQLRAHGAVFIRREFGTTARDGIYKAIFHEYMSLLLEKRHVLECFIEGTRTRNGKVRNPKTGFIKVLVDAVVSGRLPDIHLVSIAISYDSVMEGAEYVSELMGGSKQKETLTGLLNAVNRVVRLNFGAIDVHFCEPVSLCSVLREWVAQHVSMPKHVGHVHFASPPVVSAPAATSSAIAGTAAAAGGSVATHKADCAFYNALDGNAQRRFQLALAHRVMHDMNARVTVTAPALVATVLLTSLARGMSVRAIVDRTRFLQAQVIERGATLTPVFATDTIPAIVERALQTLRKSVKRERRAGIVHSYQHAESLSLCWHRNSLVHLFVSEALICIGFASLWKFQSAAAQPAAVASTTAGGAHMSANAPTEFSAGAYTFHTKSSGVSAGAVDPAAILSVERTQLLSAVALVSQLLKREFIFTPAPDIEVNFTDSIDQLIRRGVLFSSSDGAHVCIDPRGRDAFQFLCMLLWPFIDTYWVGCSALTTLLSPDTPAVDERKLCAYAARAGESAFYSGGVDFYEACNTDGLKNVFEWCTDQGITTTFVDPKSGARHIQLHAHFQRAAGVVAPAAAAAVAGAASATHHHSHVHAPAASNERKRGGPRFATLQDLLGALSRFRMCSNELSKMLSLAASASSAVSKAKTTAVPLIPADPQAAAATSSLGPASAAVAAAAANIPAAFRTGAGGLNAAAAIPAVRSFSEASAALDDEAAAADSPLLLMTSAATKTGADGGCIGGGDTKEAVDADAAEIPVDQRRRNKPRLQSRL